MSELEQTPTKQEELNEAFETIFSGNYSSKQQWNDDTFESAQVNTNEILDMVQLSLILDLAEHLKSRVQMSRSGAGLKVEFKFIKK
jgi:predicted DNA-binding protein (MmcQ/YjbR family)